MISGTSPTMGHSSATPGFRPYRWRGRPIRAVPAGPPPPSSHKRSHQQDEYRERLAAVAQMRLAAGPHPEPGEITAEQAAWELGISKRTVLRYKRRLQQMAGAS